MKASQCSEMFPMIDLEVIRAVVAQYRGNQEKILATLLEMTPKDAMTINRVKRKLKIFAVQHWQVASAGAVVTQRGLNIRQEPSMSFSTPVVGTLRSGEYVEEIEVRETKAGKLWVRHARGWSLATRKGEVGMRKVENPYSHINVDEIVAKSPAVSDKLDVEQIDFVLRLLRFCASVMSGLSKEDDDREEKDYKEDEEEKRISKTGEEAGVELLVPNVKGILTPIRRAMFNDAPWISKGLSNQDNIEYACCMQHYN
eukprot:jgi/Bigna1/141569/aug1.63_g16277